MHLAQEFRRIRDLLVHLVIEETLGHMRQDRDDRAIEEWGDSHGENRNDAADDTVRDNITVPDGGQRHDDPISVLQVNVPPRLLGRLNDLDAEYVAIGTQSRAPSAGEQVRWDRGEHEHLGGKQPVPTKLLLQSVQHVDQADDAEELQNEQGVLRHHRAQKQRPSGDQVQPQPSPGVVQHDGPRLGYHGAAIDEGRAEVEDDVGNPKPIRDVHHDTCDAADVHGLTRRRLDVVAARFGEVDLREGGED
mmetsp:Transcript_60421/g.118927  ORF Transcript_60421/g.118927 Transcript_60421/m.118927 type:complete len:248 (-) Transcript_60421:158-901(-)